jgi:hypothetical protein
MGIGREAAMHWTYDFTSVGCAVCSNEDLLNSPIAEYVRIYGDYRS